VEAYRTRQAPPDAHAVRSDLRRGVDVVTFASPSAVHSLAEALDGDLRGALQGVGVAAIGKTTAQSLEESGVEEVQVGEGGGMAGLVSACVSAVARIPDASRG
jgi:uroporphyrinogen-III synthase